MHKNGDSPKPRPFSGGGARGKQGFKRVCSEARAAAKQPHSPGPPATISASTLAA